MSTVRRDAALVALVCALALVAMWLTWPLRQPDRVACLSLAGNNAMPDDVKARLLDARCR